MVLSLLRLAAALALFFIVSAAPASDPELQARQDIKPLNSTQINEFTPITWFAGAAYCSPASTLTWTCGESCNANPNFQPVASGGDGAETQYWFVGYDPDIHTIVVSHQGTDVNKIIPVLLDIAIILRPLNSTLFPGVNPSVKVHDGFSHSQAKTAPTILAHVKSALSRFDTNSVTLTGHSLGAAIALLDAIYLPLHLPSSTNLKTVLYGQPRVGNEAFADYVDAHVLDLTHINNKEDPVPILPGRFLGYVHASGEVHIRDSGEWASCPGHDNPSPECTVGDVPSVVQSNIHDHSGPYNGVIMGSGC